MALLTAAQIQEFHERGFAVVPGVFSEREVAEMREAFDRLQRTALHLGACAEGDGPLVSTYEGSQFVLDRVPGAANGNRVRIERVVWCGAAEPTLDRLGRDPRLLSIASRLLDSIEMNQLINQAHFKLPGDGVAFPWHQDSTHRRYGGGQWKDVNGRGSFVQTVTAIDDVTEENGPLRFIPGSCKLGHIDVARDDDEARVLAGMFDPSSAITPVMKAGSVVMFGPYTVHGSEPNRSDRPRRVFINGYASPGANAREYPGVNAGRLLQAPSWGRL
jgi:ectoine hydroxylase-related dioxygenase (phytanoyl-CoA dioxygenase family)